MKKITIDINKEEFTKYVLFAALGCVIAVVLALFISFLVKVMNFANPRVLYFLIPLALLLAVAAGFKKYNSPSVKYPFAKGLKLKNGIVGLLVKWFSFALCAFALALCVIALARPRLTGKSIIPPAKGIDIMMTIDTSGSMEAADFDPNRMAAAKVTAQDFIDKRESDRIGIVVFAQIAMLQCPLTLDYTALHSFVDTININMLGGSGGTAIGDAIAVSAAHLKDSPTKSKIIILITDGESNSGTVDPVAAAKAAASYGIKVYTIAIAGEGDVQMPVESFFGTTYVNMPNNANVGEGLLKEVAATTGGEFFRAKNNAELAGIYAKINTLEKTEFEQKTEVNYKDNYAGLLSAALILLLLAFITEKFIFIKIP